MREQEAWIIFGDVLISWTYIKLLENNQPSGTPTHKPCFGSIFPILGQYMLPVHDI